jgi:hypothetical protein
VSGHRMVSSEETQLKRNSMSMLIAESVTVKSLHLIGREYTSLYPVYLVRQRKKGSTPSASDAAVISPSFSSQVRLQPTHRELALMTLLCGKILTLQMEKAQN